MEPIKDRYMYMYEYMDVCARALKSVVVFTQYRYAKCNVMCVDL